MRVLLWQTDRQYFPSPVYLEYSLFLNLNTVWIITNQRQQLQNLLILNANEPSTPSLEGAPCSVCKHLKAVYLRASTLVSGGACKFPHGAKVGGGGGDGVVGNKGFVFWELNLWVVLLRMPVEAGSLFTFKEQIALESETGHRQKRAAVQACLFFPRPREKALCDQVKTRRGNICSFGKGNFLLLWL